MDPKITQNKENSGLEMLNLMKRLFPLCRSITGNGVRETLKIIKEFIPLQIHEVPSGKKVFDWEIPPEWNIRDAYVKDSQGEKIIDFKKSNLHLLNYSIPINARMTLNELKPHLFTLTEYPKWIPYLTSYYKRNWGFCLSHKQFQELKDETYEVVIDSNIEPGHLTYGELYIEGKSKEEILFSCYTCHPSMCNDNLSGIVLLTSLAEFLLEKKQQENGLKYSYRFLFIPETIGAITWLALNEERIPLIKYGLVVTCVGAPGNFTYKKTRQGKTKIDKIVQKVLQDSGEKFEILDFWPIGSDERQFCSPAFNLAVGSLMKTPYKHFPEYHTSADDLTYVQPECLEKSYKRYQGVIFTLENDAKYINLNPKCEPQLGKRGLHTLLGGQKHFAMVQQAMLWVLNYSDGENSLLDISIRSEIDFKTVKKAADLLEKSGLLKRNTNIEE